MTHEPAHHDLAPHKNPAHRDKFTQLAEAHVQIMINSLVATHESIVDSLQEEVALLRRSLSDLEGKLMSPVSPCTTSVQRDTTISIDCASGTDASAITDKSELHLKNSPRVVGSSRDWPESGSDQALECSKIVPDFQPDATDLQLTSDNAPSNPAISTDRASGTAATEITKKNKKKQLEQSEFDNVLQHCSTQIDPINEPSTSHTKDEGKSVRTGCFSVRDFVLSQSFELITGVIILANTMVMAMEQQYNGFDSGYEIRPHEYSKPANKTWPGGGTVFFIFDNVFNVSFSVELLLRFYACGRASIRMPWMWFDTIVVVMSLLDSILSGGGLGIDPSMIRLVRLVRLVRLLKIFKSMSQFDSLFLLVKAISASVQALFWSLLILFFAMVGSALLLGQLLGDEMMDKQRDMKVRDELFMYFGTFSRSLMTLTEITLGNWVPACRLLMENIHEAFFMFFVVYRCMFCFSVVRVINAVFISETNRVLSFDTDLTMMKGERERAGYEKQIRQVLRSMDADDSGTVTWAEVEKFMGDPKISRMLHTIGFNRKHVEKVFWIVSKGSVVEIEVFVQKLLELRGDAKTVDVHCNDKLIQEILRLVQESAEGNGQQHVDQIREVQASPNKVSI